MSLPTDAGALAAGVLAGDRRALARAISIVEDDRPAASELLSYLYPRGGSARLVGVTGAPGSGKSTLVDGLVTVLRRQGATVGVVAVDPSSPFTGGALLGDRIRMQRHVSDPEVFVRSMSTRGHLGGLADATSRVVAVMDAAGLDPILIETVGVGQSEVEVVETSDTTMVVLAPGWGDGIQAAKAGILEIGDVYVVNKADLPGADSVVREIHDMLQTGPATPWRPPVLSCSAERTEGIAEVWEAVETHRRHLDESGELSARRRARAAAELRRALAAGFASRLDETLMSGRLVDEVVERRVDPWECARRVLEERL